MFYSYSIFYLFGSFQVCLLALTKKDMRDAFVEVCCCRKHGNGVRSSMTGTGHTTASLTMEEPPTVEDVPSAVLNQDVHPNEIDGNEANIAFVDKGTVSENIDEEQIGENCSGIDETKNKISMSTEDKNSVQV
jgi:hypothetical protein